MAKTFRAWEVDQVQLFPPSVRDLVPADHLAHFVRDTVRRDLDLSAILETYEEERGYPPYHPVMMTALLLYAYCRGVYSSRRMARACREWVDFMAVTAGQTPDFRTINDFRRRHLKALGALFGQVLALCQRAGLAKLGHVALDGTKVKANASKHKAMSYQRMQEEVARWFAEAERIDAEEDALYGADQSGEEMPAWMKDQQERQKRIRAILAEMESEAREEAQRKDRDDGPRPPRAGGTGEPRAKAQRNFTDPDSRIMKGRDGFVQAYNCQVAVDADSHVIVAQEVSNVAADQVQLRPMVAQIKSNLGRQAQELSADAGYLSEANLQELRRRQIRGYVATGRSRHDHPAQGPPRNHGPHTHAMQVRLRRGGFRSRYRLRKQTAEPVIGNIKAPRAFRQFLLRGLDRVRGEWSLVCLAHNLLKLAQTAG